ncbi:MAG TPA: XrtA system polysaccharide deacetylase [Candidatus Elarobacter sp.]|nr:XrtA system polysaccharide deacetylase [Candidatus Elarobacter sp.]
MPTEHVFTVDVEDYFQVYAFEGVVDRASWDLYPSRIDRNVGIILDLLARFGTTGTFFTLGWVADKHPHVVRRIADAGHEIASHGWWHRKVTTLTPDEFRDDVRASRAILEQVSGTPCVGYRAPSFSITPGHEWAFDVLLETGYQYDSSLFPIRRSDYGYPGAPPLPHLIKRPSGDIVEFPLATTRIARRRVPAAGGGYLRHFPYAVTRRAFLEHDRAGIPGVFYIHPWEIDTEQPRLAVPWLTRVRHYRNIPRALSRMELLLREFRFTSVANRLATNRVTHRATPHEDTTPLAVAHG